jgi:hypothetical protein
MTAEQRGELTAEAVARRRQSGFEPRQPATFGFRGVGLVTLEETQHTEDVSEKDRAPRTTGEKRRPRRNQL